MSRTCYQFYHCIGGKGKKISLELKQKCRTGNTFVYQKTKVFLLQIIFYLQINNTSKTYLKFFLSYRNITCKKVPLHELLINCFNNLLETMQLYLPGLVLRYISASIYTQINVGISTYVDRNKIDFVAGYLKLKVS